MAKRNTKATWYTGCTVCIYTLGQWVDAFTYMCGMQDDHDDELRRIEAAV